MLHESLWFQSSSRAHPFSYLCVCQIYIHGPPAVELLQHASWSCACRQPIIICGCQCLWNALGAAGHPCAQIAAAGSAPPASPPATNLVRCSVRGVPGSRCPRPKSATALPSKRPSLPLAETKVHCTLKTPPFLHVPAVPNSYPRPRPLHNRCESPHTFCVPARERAPIAPPASPAALRPAGFRRPKGGLFLVKNQFGE